MILKKTCLIKATCMLMTATIGIIALPHNNYAFADYDRYGQHSDNNNDNNNNDDNKKPEGGGVIGGNPGGVPIGGNSSSGIANSGSTLGSGTTMSNPSTLNTPGEQQVANANSIKAPNVNNSAPNLNNQANSVQNNDKPLTPEQNEALQNSTGVTAKDHGLRVRATKPKVTRAGHAKYDWRTAYTTNKKTKGTITLTREVSNGFSATIGFSKKAVDASVGFNVTKSMKVSVKIPYKTSGKRKERIQWAPKYNVYKVKRYV